MATKTTPFLTKLSKVKSPHLTGTEAAKLLGIPLSELLGLSRLSATPKPREVGIVTRFHTEDLRKWAVAGFPVDPKSGDGKRRSQRIAASANANGITTPGEREQLIKTFQRDGTSAEEAARKADATILARVRAKR
ncbi:MAG: hypothetical protein WD534_11515 [Phycisphaeraceae bacterium]